MCPQTTFSQYLVQALLYWLIYQKQRLMVCHNYICTAVKSWGITSWKCPSAAVVGYKHPKMKQLSSHRSMMWSIIWLVWEANVWKAIQNNYWKRKKNALSLHYICSFYYYSYWVTSYFWHDYTPKHLLGSKVYIVDSGRCQEIKLFTWGYSRLHE